MFTSQKKARAEAGEAPGDGAVVGQEDVVHLEVGAVAVEALEAIVVAGASGVAEAQEASVSAVAVVAVAVEDSEEVVVVSEGHDMYLRHEFATPRSSKNACMIEVGGKWRGNSEQSFEEGLSRFECIDFLLDVLNSS